MSSGEKDNSGGSEQAKNPDDDLRAEMGELIGAELAKLASGSGTKLQAVVTGEQRLSEAVERIRNAKLFPMRPEDLERPGGVKETYEEAHITPDTINLKLSGDDGAYNAAVSKGVWVYGFFEKPTRPETGEVGLSVYEQMMEGLSRTEAEKQQKGDFRAWFLAENLDGPMLAWSSCILPPQGIEDPLRTDNPYYVSFRHMVQYGITEGMEYQPNMFELQEFFLKNGQRVWNFDTLQQKRGMRHAADRLFAEITEIVSKERPELDIAILYRLGALKFAAQHASAASTEQNIDFEQVLRLGPNLSSYKFFNDRGYVDFAIDSNDSGFAARQIVDGKEILSYPTWIWMCGRMQKIRDRSQQIWKDVMTKNGNGGNSMSNTVTS